MTETPTAYPLSWPIGWKRTERSHRQRARFLNKERRYRSRSDGTSYGYWDQKEVSISRAIERLQTELDRLNARQAILSTNMELRLDGLPRSGQREPDDTGVACYFNLNKKPLVLACDKWDRTADNIVAVAKHIEAVRGQERWGVGSVDQAFAGYQALPQPGGHAKRPWWRVLGLDAPVQVEAAEAIYRQLAKQYHPDQPGGSHAMMAELNAAIAEARNGEGATAGG